MTALTTVVGTDFGVTRGLRPPPRSSRAGNDLTVSLR